MKNPLYLYAASIALIGLSSPVHGMDYISSFGEGEDRVKSKVVLALAPQILPPLQDGEGFKTRGQKPASHNLLLPNSACGVVCATFQKGDQLYKYSSSGTLIGPNLILTAASNLYSFEIHEGKPLGKANKVKFYPFLNGEINKEGEQDIKNFYFAEEYMKDRSENYGLLILENPIGAMTGYLGVNVRSQKQKILGLKIDAGENSLGIQDNSSSSGTSKKKSKETEITQGLNPYHINTDGNKNGYGVLYKDKQNNYFVLGINTAGEDPSGINSTTFLTKPRYEKIRGWVKDSFDKIPASTLKEGMFSNIEEADLTSKYVGNFGISVLCNDAKHLHTVNLSFNSIGDDGCKLLLGLAVLKDLNLSSNKIGDKGVRFLIQHPSIAALKLSNNYITLKDTSTELFKNSTLLSLDLSWNLVDLEGAMILAHNPNLTKLDLSSNKINKPGGALLALANNTHLKTLSFSNPYDVSLTRKALAGVGKTAGAIGRTGVVLSAVAVTGGAVGLGVIGLSLGLAEYIGGALITSALTKATLGSVVSGATFNAVSGVISTQLAIAGAGTTVGAVAGIGAGASAGIEVNTSLNEMDSVESKITKLGGKFAIGNREALALANNKNLTDLDLSDTFVTGDVISILAKSPSLTSLNLSWNNLNDNEAKKIFNLLTRNKNLTSLNLENNNITNLETLNNIKDLLNNNRI
ncbi:MAG: hypothetical protein H0X26_05740 [Alphaproteobacteria bacterium]|nr:hypothetical protein [Alphaproteobacteria bacterium]